LQSRRRVTDVRAVAPALALAVLLGVFGCGGAREESGLDSLTRVLIENVSPKATPQDIDRSAEILRNRLDKLGVPDPSVSTEGERIELIVPTGSVELSLLLRTGRLEFFDLQGDLVPEVSLDEQRFPRPSQKPLKARPKTVVVTCGAPARYCPGVEAEPEPMRTYYYLFQYDPDDPEHPIPELTGEDLELKGTRQDFDPTTNEPVVLIQFTASGAEKFEDITRRLVERGRVLANQRGWTSQENDVANQQFAIVLDREIKSAPFVDFDENPGGIPGDNGAQIAGIYSLREARELALVLQTGALPLDFRVVSKEEARK